VTVTYVDQCVRFVTRLLKTGSQPGSNHFINRSGLNLPIGVLYLSCLALSLPLLQVIDILIQGWLL